MVAKKAFEMANTKADKLVFAEAAASDDKKDNKQAAALVYSSIESWECMLADETVVGWAQLWIVTLA